MKKLILLAVAGCCLSGCIRCPKCPKCPEPPKVERAR